MNKKIIVILTFSEEVCRALADDLSSLGEYTSELLPGLVFFTIDGERHEKMMKDIVCACKNKSLDFVDNLQPLYFTAKANESYCQESCLTRGCPCFSTIDVYVKLEGHEPFCMKHAACVCECGAEPVADSDLTFRTEPNLALPPLLEDKGEKKKKGKKNKTKEPEEKNRPEEESQY